MRSMTYRPRIPATGWAYLIFGAISFARAYTWHRTSWSNSPHVGFLASLPDTFVTSLWILAGVSMCVAWWQARVRFLAVPLTACLNCAVGAASFFNRAFLDGTGVTVSVAISYLGIGVLVLILPLLTDKKTFIDGEDTKV